MITLLRSGALVTVLLSAACASAEPESQRLPQSSASLTEAFAEHDAVGTMVIRRLSDGHEWVHAPARADTAFLPASTFKIVNAAIALETGVASSANDRYEWDGVERGNAAWNRDHTLETAMSVSAVPVYQQIARSIGAERMSQWLDRVDFGNADISGGIDQFWLTGGLRTSAREQVDFLSRFVSGQTAFSPRTFEIVSDLTLVEEGPGWALHAKTGWADVTAIGWWSGWTRVGEETYVFALNMVMADVESASKRIEIAREALSAVGALPR